MKINKPKQQAIALIESRILEIEKARLGDDLTAWQSRTVSDLDIIFGDYSKQGREINSITISAFAKDLQFQTFHTARFRGIDLLKSYISLINDHVQDAILSSESEMEKARWNLAVLNTKYSNLVHNYNTLNALSKEKDARITKLEGSMLQLEKMSFGNVLSIITALPAIQIWAAIVVIFAIASGLIYAGFWYGTNIFLLKK